MNRVQTLLVIAIVVAFLGALAFQAYGLNLVRLGKTKTSSMFALQAVKNIDPLAGIKSASLTDLAKENLMGNPDKVPPKPVAVVTKPAEPPASITLTGIVTSTIPGRSSAFIQVNTITKRVFIGESVDGVATLQEIKNDSVTLKRGDKIEVLRYPSAPAVAAQPVAQPVPHSNSGAISAQAVTRPAPVSSGPDRSDPRTRLWRLPPDRPGGSPRDTREKK